MRMGNGKLVLFPSPPAFTPCPSARRRGTSDQSKRFQCPKWFNNNSNIASVIFSQKVRVATDQTDFQKMITISIHQQASESILQHIGGVCRVGLGLSSQTLTRLQFLYIFSYHIMVNKDSQFFPANMCHNVLLSIFGATGTITLTHFTISIIIHTCNQNED